jgi:uncharacterized protein YgbK (DUF1537 family)
MRTIQVSGVPEPGTKFENVDAVVVALKSRTIEPQRAIEQSMAALAVLQEAGARQIVFKYCSTFDSTDHGNIGPVTEALQNALNAPVTVACPSFPANGRSVYQGHLFVGNQLLNESPLKDHPLTPMRDANLVRVLQRQAQGRVGLVPWQVVSQGADSITAAISSASEQGQSLVIVDALCDQDLLQIGKACAEHALVTGGSGVAAGLPENFRQQGILASTDATDHFEYPPGATLALAGSCSVATRAQIQRAREAGFPVYHLDPFDLIADDRELQNVCAWVTHTQKNGSLPPLVYSSSTPDDVARFQQANGGEQAGAIIERAYGQLACHAYETGTRKLIVAGGETSGAVVNALGIRQLEIGPEIAPGVPWTVSRNSDTDTVGLALKSGNFGGPDLFEEAWRMANESRK